MTGHSPGNVARAGHKPGNRKETDMKYYIKATNTETGKTEIMATPVFTNRKKAEEWADQFEKTFCKSVAKLKVIRQDER